MLYLWLKAFHIIFMVTWFAGLFYLPRLFVYHALSSDAISIARFKIMERRLYYGITYPGGVLTTIVGLWLLWLGWETYKTMGWMHAKLALVVLLWAYHLSCGHFVRVFAKDGNQKSDIFYRFFNEVPVLFLCGIVILVVVHPF